MSFKTYIDIECQNEISAEMRFAMNQTMTIIHRMIGIEKREIAVDFPRYFMKNGGKDIGLGNLVRVFSSHDVLVNLIQNLTGLSKSEYVTVSNIKDCSNTTEKICTMRDRSSDKKINKGNSRYKRMMKRYEQKEKQWEFEEDEKRMRYPHFKIRSLSTGQLATIYVKREVVTENFENKIGSYGLSTETHKTSIPLIV